MHKEVVYNSDISHSFCLYEVYKNASILVKGINSSLNSSDILSLTAHDLVETNTCNLSSKDCMLGNCPECLKPGLSLSDFKADIDLISFFGMTQVETKILKVSQMILFSQVIPKMDGTLKQPKKHIYRKREQLASYNKQKNELKTGEALIHVHVDYSKSYNNTQQDEIQSAYFGRQNVCIFTSSSYYDEIRQGNLAEIAVISKSSDHYRTAAFTCTKGIVNELIH